MAHDPVTINGYGTARQITLFEHGKVALQVLTSGTSTCPVALLTTLRAHWRIENTFKYASEHHRIDALADYIADIETSTRPIDNPARKTANATVKARKNDLGDAETARDGAPAKLPANQIDPTPDAPSTHHPPHPEVDPESTQGQVSPPRWPLGRVAPA